MNYRKKGLLVFLFCLLVVVGYAQTPTALDLEIERAQRAYDIKKFNTAASLFKKAYPKVKDEDRQNEILFRIAESYRQANNFRQAFDWYEKLVNTKYPDPRILYSYGLLLKNFERYDDAARQFNDFLFEVPNDPNAKRELLSCAVAQGWKSNPEKFDVRNIAPLNTPLSDYAPFYTDGKLVWASSRPEATGSQIFEWTGQKCSDFFESSLTNGAWSKPANLKGAVNSNFNEGVAWLDSTATTIYFTQCNGADGKGVNCKIYESHFRNGQWSDPFKLPFNSDSFSVGHPAFSPDGKRLYFSSNMPGGLGEKDLYYIDYTETNSTWGVPVNLGPNVNSNEDDMFPYMSADGVLYYSTKGRTGMGGLDIFKTADSSGTYKVAANLRSPINSGGDDFGISFTGKNAGGQDIAYFSSNREGGKGDDDIYGIAVKPFVFLVKGKVFDKETSGPLSSAKVELRTSTGAPVSASRTGDDGAFTIEIPLNQSFSLMASKERYFSSNSVDVSSLGIQKDTVIVINFTLEPIPAEDVEFTLQGIYYDLDKADLRPEARKVLDSLTIILNNNPTLVIELASHTDSRAEADYNIKLSQRRAQSCVDYLLQKGISKDRMVATGYGETKLVNDCVDGVDCTEEEHQQNRRTTFRVLRTDYKPKR